MKIEDVLHTKHVLRSPDIFPGHINRGVRLTVCTLKGTFSAYLPNSPALILCPRFVARKMTPDG